MFLLIFSEGYLAGDTRLLLKRLCAWMDLWPQIRVSKLKFNYGPISDFTDGLYVW